MQKLLIQTNKLSLEHGNRT